MRAQLRKNWFLLGLLAALGLAVAAPGVGAGLNPHKIPSTVAVILIFLLSGLSLPTESMIKGIRDYRLHLYVQAVVFIAIPLYFYATGLVFAQFWDENVQMGVYALAVLPTTVSSCIVLTQLAGGNVAGTIFNAVFSNMIGVVVTPLLLTLLLSGSGRMLPASEVVRILLNLAMKVLLPFVAGQIAHRLFAEQLASRRRLMGRASGALILLIVYFAFAKAAGNPELKRMLPSLPWMFTYLAVSHVLLALAAVVGARLIGLRRADRLTVLFTAPQKTLAMGAPFVSIYFAGQPEVLAVALLPILFYHPWQIFVAGVLMHTRLGRAVEV